jgi:glucose/mannose transport system substrate-binding protein
MRFSHAVLALFAATSSVACGGSDDGETKETDNAADEVKLEVFSWWVQPGEIEALQALFDLHKSEHPNQRIFNAVEESGPVAKQVLADRLEAGNPPDLFQQNAYEMRAFIAEHPGDVQPLDELFAEQGLADAIAPEVIDAITVDGHIYSVPINAHRENSLFYNKQLFKEHDLEAPATLDDFLAACETLKQAGVTPVALSTSQSWIISKLFISLAMGSMGGSAFRDYFSGDAPLDEVAFADAIDVLDTVLTNYIDVEQAATDGYGWTQCTEAVFRGDAAMLLHGDWAKGYFSRLGWTPDVDFGVVGAPGASEVFLYGTDVFGVPTGAKHSEEAFEFVRTIASKEGQVAFNTYKGSSPVRFDVPTDEFDPMAQQVIADFENAEIRITLQWQNTWDEALGAFAMDHDHDALLAAFRDNPPVK